MTVEEYFGDWMDVIDRDELVKISAWLKTQNPNILCPAHKDVFKAFRMCSLADCKVIMVGQDPFPQKGVATGILFGNKPNTTNISPSLEVIKRAAMNGNNGIFDITMESWAKQGVLMLNSILTVRKDEAASHKDLGWQLLTDHIIKLLNMKSEPVVFILWGNYAKSKKQYITNPKHLVIESAHPSPFSARYGFFGSKPFSRANNFLKANKIKEVDFTLPNHY